MERMIEDGFRFTEVGCGFYRIDKPLS